MGMADEEESDAATGVNLRWHYHLPRSEESSKTVAEETKSIPQPQKGQRLEGK
jgi:hypothetical protein